MNLTDELDAAINLAFRNGDDASLGYLKPLRDGVAAQQAELITLRNKLAGADALLKVSAEHLQTARDIITQ